MEYEQVTAPGMQFHVSRTGGISFRVWTQQGGSLEYQEFPVSVDQALQTATLLLRHVFAQADQEQPEQQSPDWPLTAQEALGAALKLFRFALRKDDQERLMKSTLDEAAVLVEAGRQAVQQ